MSLLSLRKPRSGIGAYSAFLGGPAVGGPTLGNPLRARPFLPAITGVPAGIKSALDTYQGYLGVSPQGGPTVGQPGVAAPPGPQNPAGSKSPWSLDTDPYVQDVRAAGGTSVADAETAADRQRRAVLAGFGSQELAREYLGNDPFVATISDNPDTSLSTLAQLKRAYQHSAQSTDEQLSANNLFYGQYRANQLNDLSYANQSDVAGATGQARSALEAISQAVLQAKADARQRALDAERNAYDRHAGDAAAGTDTSGGSTVPGSSAGSVFPSGPPSVANYAAFLGLPASKIVGGPTLGGKPAKKKPPVLYAGPR